MASSAGASAAGGAPPAPPPPSRVVAATHSAPSNIACIKYWGKRDAKANTPINSSVSVTMSQDDLCATTTVTASPDFPDDRLWLNGR
jgi:diphosphomevalonate decarboxylase